jgi:hypothetical protein
MTSSRETTAVPELTGEPVSTWSEEWADPLGPFCEIVERCEEGFVRYHDRRAYQLRCSHKVAIC